MKLYKITANQVGAPVAQFVGSQAEASKLRKELVSDLGFKRADISTEEVDVPTSKKELIEWLNRNCA